jgi:protein TIF31
MVQVCNKLNIDDKIEVIDGQGNHLFIAASPDVKGILGSNQRKYIVDLLRLSPRDLNYEG